ncbi:myo-inositol-1(or 4)-monophosphatase [Pseudonocardia hierapolitana]|uniref:Myo-inositol-1(Or 4)-monophosphatase n=1 Tax=Pseudonocardia hierapolitana TaxID=1128676 RepID=A0A561T051_9PSEU|nr:inositol monophosphatase family protein [Pseudonocardia hierapolitana]TWF80484.1 myo-inositol-1(or 4)-monophosphatase [Pseudonocardia hierapolitana]
MNRDLDALLDVAVGLAHRAGRLQLERRAALVVQGAKAHANDLVSDVDLASEQLLVDGLLRACPDDGLLGEEGTSRAGTTGWSWVIDPLDGTRNYISGTGPWSVSIALQEGDSTRLGVVHDPVAGETFTAVAAHPPRLGGHAVTARRATRLTEALAGVSYNPSPATKQRIGPVLATLLPRVGDVRRLPAALELAYLAVGRLDVGVVIGTHPWDVAAGLFLASQAGLVLTGPDGEATPELTICAAPQLWDDFAAVLAETDLLS